MRAPSTRLCVVDPAGQWPASKLSCRLTATRATQPRLRLDDRDEVAGEYVHFVVGRFYGGQFTLVPLAGQFIDARPSFGVGLEADQLAGGFLIQRRADGIEKTFKDVAV